MIPVSPGPQNSSPDACSPEPLAHPHSSKAGEQPPLGAGPLRRPGVKAAALGTDVQETPQGLMEPVMGAMEERAA